MKAVIIDDEKMARLLLEGMITDNFQDIEIVASCSDLPSGVKAIRKLKPDLVFLDIEMPEYSGLDILDFFDEDRVDFSIIFTTAYNQFALEAFQMSAIGYLLKPIEPTALIKVISNYNKIKGHSNFAVLRNNLQEDQDKKIALTTLNTTKFVPLSDVVLFKAVGAYTEVKLNTTEVILVSKGLKKFELTLQNQNAFFRCHKSYIVNTKYITEHSRKDGGYLTLTNKDIIPVASDRVPELYEKMKSIKD